MAAEVLAHTLGCRLYAIDLSTVVSKFIERSEANGHAVPRNPPHSVDTERWACDLCHSRFSRE